MPAPDLNALALAAGRGDQQAVGELVAHTSTPIWRLCAYLVDRQSADDLTQETYLRAVRALPRFRAEAPILTWLLTIARRVCLAEIDRRARQRETTLYPVEVDIPVAAETGLIDIEQLLDTLEPERRIAFVLTQVIGCSYQEAAEVCRCPVGTIRSRVARARQDLINQMRPPAASAGFSSA